MGGKEEKRKKGGGKKKGKRKERNELFRSAFLFLISFRKKTIKQKKEEAENSVQERSKKRSCFLFETMILLSEEVS